MQEPFSTHENTYPIDPESPAEMARLINLDSFTTRAMGGPLFGVADPSRLEQILDIACGPGGWALDVAFAYPKSEVAGIDISRVMIDYANTRALSQGLTNASFGVMDITQPLDFADESFDLINARFLVAVLKRDMWKPFLAECMRLLRPGGILRLTEGVDAGDTNSAAFDRMLTLTNQGLWQLGYGFSPSGRTFGVTPVLSKLLRDEGYQQVHYDAHALEFSLGMDAWADFFRNTEIGYKLGLPLLVHLGFATPEEAERMYQQMLREMHLENFCGVWTFLTVSGIKPF